MDIIDFFYMVLRWMPFFAAFVCIILLAIHLFRHTTVPLSVRIIPILVLITFGINWLYANLLYFLNSLPILIVPLLFLSAVLTPVLLYNLVSRLTRLHSDERFPKWHYLMPGLVFILVLIWAFLNWNKVLSLSPRADNIEMQLICPNLFYTISYLRMIVTLVYIVPSIMRIRCYRREAVHYSSNEYHISLRWLLILVLIFGIQIIITGVMCLLHIGKYRQITTNPMIILIVILLVWQITLITYNILNGNFEIVANGNNCVSVTDGKGGNNVLSTEQQDSFKQKLEEYIESNKSYLKPDLRITELTTPLAMNRAYLSAFINDTYGMNFCRFINSYRLKEYERLRADESNREYTNTELALRAGFPNYIGLYRAQSYQKKTFIYSSGFQTNPETDRFPSHPSMHD